MRFAWDRSADAWIGDGSKPGPAGTAAMTVGGLSVEFDRVDRGRIVSVIVRAGHSADTLLGTAADYLLPPEEYFLDEPDSSVPERPYQNSVNLFGTPLWDASEELARLAELAEDAPRLAAAGEHNAAAIAYAELAQALHDLRALGVAAPDAIDAALRQAEELLQARRPLVYSGAHDLKDLARHLRAFAPARFRPVIDLLGEPRTAHDAHWVAASPAPATLRLDPSADPIRWRSEESGTFPDELGVHRWRIEWDGLTAVVTIDDPMPFGAWLTLHDERTLLAEGPLVPHGSSACLRTGLLRTRPTGAKVVAHPYRTPGARLLPIIRQANELGRRALRLEHRERSRAAAAWRECAQSWLAVDETGRAAIALDRAADSALSDGQAEAARRDRERAQALAPAWTWSMVGVRTGSPHRPLWSCAPASFEELDAPSAAQEDPNSAAHRTQRSQPLVPAMPRQRVPLPAGRVSGSHWLSPRTHRPYVFVCYARDDAPYVQRLVDMLTGAGVSVWYDQLAVGGTPLRQQLVDRIERCAAVVVVVSGAAEASELVSDQLLLAGRRGRPVFPLLLSGTMPPTLANTRYEDVSRTGSPSAAFIERLRALAPHTTAHANRHARVVGRGFPTNSKQFVGREEHLLAIEGELLELHTVAVRAVGGAAGVGVSQLVAEYVRRHRDAYDVIAWIDAERPELIADQVAALLGPEVGVTASPAVTPTAHAVLAALDRTNPSWLLIFDNATDPEHLREWLSRSPEGHMIITSRHAGWERLAGTVSVDVLDRGEAVQLLLRGAARTEQDAPAADEIVHLLHRLPLALEQAAGYLASTGMPAREYVEILRTHDAGRPVPDSTEPAYERAMAAVWAVSRADLHQASPAAEQLLRLCSFLGEAPIPLELFTRHPETLPPPLSDVARSAEGFNRTVQLLLHRGLAHERTGGLAVHRLLADAVRRPLGSDEREAATGTVRELLALHLPTQVDREPGNWPTWRALLPHVLTATAGNDALPDERNRLPVLLDGAGGYLRAQGQPAAARPLFERAVRINERAHGPDDPLVAAGLNNLALTLKDLGRPAEAQPLLERALRIDESAHGPNHPVVADELNNLAAVLYDLGRPDEARELLQRAMRIDEDTRGPDSPQVATDLNQLASVLDKLGRPAEARRVLERALRIDESTHGPDDPRVADDLHHLATMLHRMGQLAAARPLLKRALDILVASYGYDHPTVKAIEDALDLLPDAPEHGLFQKGLATRLRWERNEPTGKATAEPCPDCGPGEPL